MPHDEKLDIAEFTVHLRSVLLPMGLTVDDVRLAGRGLHLQNHPFGYTMSDPGQMEVFVGEASLANFLEKMAPAGLQKFQVSAHDGKLFITAVKKVIVELKASAVCTLRIEEGRRLFVELETVDVAGAGLKNLMQSQLEKINPIVDMNDFPVDATIETVTVANAGIVMFGKVSPS